MTRDTEGKYFDIIFKVEIKFSEICLCLSCHNPIIDPLISEIAPAFINRYDYDIAIYKDNITNYKNILQKKTGGSFMYFVERMEYFVTKMVLTSLGTWAN